MQIYINLSPTGIKVIVVDASSGRFRVGQDDFGGRRFLQLVARQDISNRTATWWTSRTDRRRCVQGHVKRGPAVVRGQSVRAGVAAVQHNCSGAHLLHFKVEQSQTPSNKILSLAPIFRRLSIPLLCMALKYFQVYLHIFVTCSSTEIRDGLMYGWRLSSAGHTLKWWCCWPESGFDDLARGAREPQCFCAS
jgi:hypothetical protein